MIDFEAGAKWALSQVASANGAVDTVAEGLDIYRSKKDMNLEINRLRSERDFYKGRGGSAKGQP